MTEMLATLLRLSVLGSLLAGVLFLLKPLLQGRVSRTVSYYLWLLVLLRLCVPAGLTLPLPESSTLTPVTAPAVQAAGENPSTQPAAPAQTTTPTTAGNANAHPQASAPKAPAVEPGQVLVFLWAAGAVVVGGWYVTGYLRIRRTIHRTAEPASPAARELLAELDPSGRVRLVVSPAVNTPLLLGVLHPTVVLPQGVTDPERLRDILAHELTHARRYDLLYKWFAAFAASVHWFNPLLPFIRREIGRACELSCDEAVVKTLDASRRKHYGETLLALAADAPVGALPLAVTLCEEKKHLQERLVNIVNVHKRTPAALLLTLTLTVGLGGCALFTHAEPSRQAPQSFTDAQRDITINLDMTLDEVVGLLGQGHLEYEQETGVQGREEALYSYDPEEGGELYVRFLDGKVDTLTAFGYDTGQTFSWATEAGITFGSTMEEVQAQYQGWASQQLFQGEDTTRFLCQGSTSFDEDSFLLSVTAQEDIGVCTIVLQRLYANAAPIPTALTNASTGAEVRLGQSRAEIEAVLGTGTDLTIPPTTWSDLDIPTYIEPGGLSNTLFSYGQGADTLYISYCQDIATGFATHHITDLDADPKEQLTPFHWQIGGIAYDSTGDALQSRYPDGALSTFDSMEGMEDITTQLFQYSDGACYLTAGVYNGSVGSLSLALSLP